MGNCQAAEAAAVVIMHPGKYNKIERINNSVSARHVMSLNPGYYVGVLVTMQGPKPENGMLVKKLKLKLLRPDDMLLIGNVYRLVGFEDVLKEFAAKKCAKLGKLLKERGVLVLEKKGRPLDSVKESNASSIKRHNVDHGESNSNRSRARGRHQHHQHQWKPVLKSISESEN